jgi:hypothetical protein
LCVFVGRSRDFGVCLRTNIEISGTCETSERFETAQQRITTAGTSY